MKRPLLVRVVFLLSFASSRTNVLTLNVSFVTAIHLRMAVDSFHSSAYPDSAWPGIARCSLVSSLARKVFRDRLSLPHWTSPIVPGWISSEFVSSLQYDGLILTNFKGFLKNGLTIHRIAHRRLPYTIEP